MVPAIGLDERISEIMSALLAYREPDTEDVRCAIDSILELIEEEREACAKIADEEAQDIGSYQSGQVWRHASEEIAKKIRARSAYPPKGEGDED